MWQAHLQTPTNHVVHVRAFVEFEKQHPASALVPVARGASAWHLLQQNERAAATQLLIAMLDRADTPAAKAGAEMARRWLTRLDRERVKAALRAYHGRHVEYPGSLQQLTTLTAAEQPPQRDRWDKLWQYQLGRFKHLKTISGQRYELLSPTLGPDSDLAAALARPYPTEGAPKPLRFLSRAEGQRSLLFATAGGQAGCSEGGSVGNWTLARAGESMIVMCGGDYWQVQAAPAEN